MSLNNEELFRTLLDAVEANDTETYNRTLKNAKKVIKDMTRVGLEAIDELNEEHEAQMKKTTTTTETVDDKTASGFDGQRFG